MKNQQLTIYTRPTCLDCQDLKLFLNENNVAYQLKEVATGSPEEEELIALTGNRIVPTLHFQPKGLFKKAQLFTGFAANRQAIIKLLTLD